LKIYGSNPQMIVVEDEFADTIDKDPNALPPAITTTPPQNPEPHKGTPPSSFVDVTVKKGDALEKIARSNGTTVEAIKKANNLKNSKLNIGQVLKVPVGTKTAAAKPVEKKETKNVAASGEEYYTIKNGDNPWKVAKQYNVKFDDLLKMNGLNEDKARNLKVGDKIRVK
jgi:peptidoglycan DL-endopeptidase LytF